ncbi:HAMP domain-containing histidine kinase [Candidatus Gracilibacteria bacterium]|nr:HAMP domain-containing histidine kinase [Candidatus Gracilibacteria bacterium]
MNKSYSDYILESDNPEQIEIFQAYLLTKDTLIISDDGDLICSPGVAKKIREEPEEIQNRFLYKDDTTIYFIYSEYYEGIGEVKVFFDITSYLKGQISIIQISLIFMILIFFLHFFFGKILTRYHLRDLQCIAQKVSQLSLSSTEKYIHCNLPKNDEISILVEALNSSYRALEEETQKLKQFQTDVSHEFKTPLMVMQSRLDVLQKKHEKGMLSGSDQEVFFNIARKSIMRMNTLIETLFFLSRCESSDGSCLQRENVDMKGFFEEKKEEILAQFSEKNIKILLNIEDNLIYHIERVSFSILLSNVMENAIKFSDGDIFITLTAKKDFFSISDNGVGISELEREKIFEKFYRKDTNKEGFGVGLSLVKRIALMYQWKIELESKQGEGTEFRFIF